MKLSITSINKLKKNKMPPQSEREAKCFVCGNLRFNCKILKNQDSTDAICKEDFIKLLINDTDDYVQICTSKEAENMWNKIDITGTL